MGAPRRSCPAPLPGRVLTGVPGKPRLFHFEANRRCRVLPRRLQNLPANNPPFTVLVCPFRASIGPRLQLSTVTVRSLGPVHPRELGIEGGRPPGRGRQSVSPSAFLDLSYTAKATYPHRAGLAWHGVAYATAHKAGGQMHSLLPSVDGNWLDPFQDGGHMNLYGPVDLGCCNIGLRAHLVLGHTRKMVSSGSKG